MNTWTAEKHLAEVQKLATARLKACKLAAKHESMALVDAERLRALEALADAVFTAFGTAKMTRDYADVQKLYPDEHYNGKRLLVRRGEAEAVFRMMKELGCTNGPIGHLVKD